MKLWFYFTVNCNWELFICLFFICYCFLSFWILNPWSKILWLVWCTQQNFIKLCCFVDIKIDENNLFIKYNKQSFITDSLSFKCCIRPAGVVQRWTDYDLRAYDDPPMCSLSHTPVRGVRIKNPSLTMNSKILN